MAKVRRRPEDDQVPSNPSESARIGGNSEERGREYSSDRVAARAYELYLARGGSDGQDFDDWLTAERELASGPSQGDPKE
jgi:hypothetical protein